MMIEKRYDGCMGQCDVMDILLKFPVLVSSPRRRNAVDDRVSIHGPAVRAADPKSVVNSREPSRDEREIEKVLV